MEDQAIDIHDHRQQQCRMLGYRNPLDYCRRMNSGFILLECPRLPEEFISGRKIYPPEFHAKRDGRFFCAGEAKSYPDL